jgi:hypothetical protein
MNEQQPGYTAEVNAAWHDYQQRLGLLTQRHEAMIERAFRSGWYAAAAKLAQPSPPRKRSKRRRTTDDDTAPHHQSAATQHGAPGG